MPKRQASEEIAMKKCVSMNKRVDHNKFISFYMEIIDTGIGIKKENLDKLFIDYSKLDDNSKLNQTGTGLGLSICKRIIEKMGGSVVVKSKLNEGTKFIVKLQAN